MSRRRSPGEGTIGTYRLKDGRVRWTIKYVIPNPDGGPGKAVRRKGYVSQRDAQKALRQALKSIDEGAYVDAKGVTLSVYLDGWLAALHLKESTIEDYSKCLRLHVIPHIGSVRLDALTPTRLNALYVSLGQGGGLSPAYVRHVHVVLRRALEAAVEDDLLVRNPADRARPPTGESVRPPEMKVWTAEQARDFLLWAEEHRAAHFIAWRLIAYTGMRRGEAVGLTWSDIDLSASRLTVRRSIGVVTRDHKTRSLIGSPKTGRSRVIDLDGETVAHLKSWRSQRAALGLGLIHADAYVLGRADGSHICPNSLYKRFVDHQAAFARHRPDDILPTIRLHDLRHTHATALLAAGIPVKVVSERLGHSDVTTTLRTYTHVLPGMQAEAAEAFASLLA
jgi:integrase